MCEDFFNMSFEDIVIYCCKQDEYVLRNDIKNNLTSTFNFSVEEDNYISYRNTTDKYNSGNMLFTRGSDPKICLVAHTDVVRDHSAFRNNDFSLSVEPVVKELNGRQIIQDKECYTQVGGDDRLGVAIIWYIAMHTKESFGILLTTDEEVGLRSADHVKFQSLNNFALLLEIDRGRYSNQIINEIYGWSMCDDITLGTLQWLATSFGIPRESESGASTDILKLKFNDVCKNAVNITCGYYNPHSNDEYIDIVEAKETCEYVKFVVQNFE